MAGPIGIAIAKAITAIRCPHCGTRQARARERHVQSYVCTHCRRRFQIGGAPATSPAKKKRQ